MKFKTAILAILFVVIVHIMAILLRVYNVWPSWDIPMHFAGGFVMALFGLAIHHAIAEKHHANKSPHWYHYLFVIGFVMLVAVSWEFHEYILDNTVVLWYNWTPTQPSLPDTVLDLFLGWLGGTVAFIAFRGRL